MKIALDENISYRVACAIRAFMANRPGFEVSYVRETNKPGTKDPAWLAKFAADGGDAVVSGDPNILQHWPDLIAYTESGLISFFPPPRFGELKGYGKAAMLIRWWPAIVEKIKVSNRGDRWRIPYTWTPDPTRFEMLTDPRITTDEQKRKIGIEPTAKVLQFRP